MTAGAIGVLLLFTIIDMFQLLRGKKWRELVVFSIMTSIALIYIIRFVMGLDTFSFIKNLDEFTRNTLGLDYRNWQGHS